MALSNTWVTYLNRSYKSIKSSILTRMKSVVPEITDYSESNIFVIMVSMFAGLVEQLNYYIDNIARESFISTARRYSSVIKLTRLIDYRVRAKVGAVVDLRITAVDAMGNPVTLEADETINAGLIVSDGATEFITTKRFTIFAGTSSSVAPARQGTLITGENIGTTTANTNQVFNLSSNYRDGSLEIEIDSVSWQLVETFAFSGPLDKHYIVNVNESKQAYVLFGDGVNGEIPPNGQAVLATYYDCVGSDGNVEANTLTQFNSAPTPPTQTDPIDKYEVTNELPAVAGLDEENIERIRAHAPLSLRTLSKAVTLQDHKDLALLVPGVGKASVDFDYYTKNILFYIAPEEGGTAPSSLLSDVVDYFQDKKMISTAVQAYAAGETKLRITLNVTARFRRSISDTTDDIKEALQNAFGFNNSDVDKKVRRSDIIALIDNLDRVDFLSLDLLTTKPYPRITEGVNQLEGNWYVTVNPTTSVITPWRLTVTGASILGSQDGTARLYKTLPTGQEQYQGTVTLNQADPGNIDFTSNDGTLSLGIYGTFSENDEWSFKTYPYNEDIEFEDFTIPIYDEEELSLTVNEQLGL